MMHTFFFIVIVCKNSARGQALRPFLQADLMQLLPIIGTEFAGILSFAYYIHIISFSLVDLQMEC